MMMQSRHAVECTRDCVFVMAYLYPNQCWATWREERNGHQALLELHQTRKEASERHNARVAFQRQVEGT